MEQLKNIKAVVMDVDGVLTDGRIIVDSNGVESKNFNVQDGLGIVLLKKVGIKTALISARQSAVSDIRGRDLGVDRIFNGVHPKLSAYESLLVDFAVEDRQVCYIGDDVVDLCILKRVGFAVAVNNAVAQVKSQAHYVTQRNGGQGAVREVIEMILREQGLWQEQLWG